MARMKHWQQSVSFRTAKDFEVDLGGCSYSEGENSNFWITLYRNNSEEKSRLVLNREEAKKLLESLNDFVGPTGGSNGGGLSNDEIDGASEDEIKDWRYEVANGDTVLGLQEWRMHKKESESE